MTRDRIEETLRRIKFCMRRRIAVTYNNAEYYVAVLNLRHSKRDGFYYTVQLDDINRLNSSITVGIESIDWPIEGNGYTL